MNHDIRLFRPEDAADLAAVYRAAWTATYGPVISSAGLATILADLDSKGVTGLIPGRDEVAYVACDGPQVVGSAVFAERGGQAYLWAMYILPEYQRRGLGTALIRYGAARLNADSTVVAGVLKTSASALRFYAKLGFHPKGEYEFELAPGEPIPSVEMRASARELAG
jgi:ribosomal protein S18 acetylase RimI-like enzyme